MIHQHNPTQQDNSLKSLPNYSATRIKSLKKYDLRSRDYNPYETPKNSYITIKDQIIGKQENIPNTAIYSLNHLVNKMYNNEMSREVFFGNIQKVIHEHFKCDDPLSKAILNMSSKRFEQIFMALQDFINCDRHINGEKPEQPNSNTFKEIKDNVTNYNTSFNYNMGMSDIPVILSLLDFKKFHNDKDTIIGVTFSHKNHWWHLKLDDSFYRDTGLTESNNKGIWANNVKFHESCFYNLQEIFNDIKQKNGLRCNQYIPMKDLNNKTIYMSLDQADTHNVAVKIDFKCTDVLNYAGINELIVISKITDPIPKHIEDERRPYQASLFHKDFRAILRFVIERNVNFDNANSDNVNLDDSNLYFGLKHFHTVEYSNQQIGGYCTSLAQQIALEGAKTPQTRDDHVHDLAWTRGRAIATKKLVDESELLQILIGKDNIQAFKDRLDDIKTAVTADMLNIRYTELPYHHYGKLCPPEDKKQLPSTKENGSEYLDYLERLNNLDKVVSAKKTILSYFCKNKDLIKSKVQEYKDQKNDTISEKINMYFL